MLTKNLEPTSLIFTKDTILRTTIKPLWILSTNNTLSTINIVINGLGISNFKYF